MMLINSNLRWIKVDIDKLLGMETKLSKLSVGFIALIVKFEKSYNVLNTLFNFVTVKVTLYNWSILIFQ